MAADGRRHIIAVGGGMLVSEGKVPLHMDYALRLTGRPEPRICLLNTAGGDDPRWALLMYDRFAGHPARLRPLALFPMPNVADPDDLLLSQDVIFVGGGSVANMLAVWRVHGLDVILRKAWQAGIILAGSSAGGICWFEAGTTDSFGRNLRAFTDGLGMLAGSYCPHYNSEPGRRPLYHQLVTDGMLPGGIACDDGAAAHFTDETLTELIADRPGASAYRVDPGITETRLGTRFLGDSQGLGPAVPRRRYQPSAPNTQTGSSHQALTPAACTSSAVSARAATTTAATRQSSPITKSYQNAPIALSRFMSWLPPPGTDARPARWGGLPAAAGPYSRARPARPRGRDRAGTHRYPARRRRRPRPPRTRRTR